MDLESPNMIKIEKDYAYRMFKSIYDHYIAEIGPSRWDIRDRMSQGERLFIAGLREMHRQKILSKRKFNYVFNLRNSWRLCSEMRCIMTS